MAKYPATLHDIAKALGTSIGTVHRALHDHPGVSPTTRTRVLQMARSLRYKPNLAARYLSSKRTFRISVNTLRGTTSFWDEVRAGISEEAASLPLQNVEIDFRTFPNVGEGEEQAFETALRDKVNGVITFPSNPETLRPWIRRASQASIPVVCVATDAPQSGRTGIVAIDTLASGSIAADLMGRFLGEREGPVAITLFDMGITEHAEKYSAFESTLRSFYPKLQLLKPIEDYGVEITAYSKCRKLFEEHPDVRGVYVTTEDSIPVVNAARDAGLLSRVVIIATDLFPALVPQIRSGAVAATIYQRPRTQGRMALRILHAFLTNAGNRSHRITLAPHLVMRGNLDFFLQRQSQESIREETAQVRGKVPRA